MENLTQVTTYQQYKQAMDTELRRTTEGFVRIGYLLKVARDTDILRESGYASVVEFAQKEYNIDKTQVSRFIHINDRFSEGGYSDHLLEKYQDFGYAKLTIMLQLPDELNEVLTPEYSKAEIQTLKEEMDEEQKITDIEVMLEEQDTAQAELETTMAKVLHQLFKDNPEKFAEVYAAVENGLAAVLEVLAPSGTMLYNVRLSGMGRIAFSIREDSDTADLVAMRTGDMENVPWAEVMKMLESMINPLHDAKSEWEKIYGEAFPKENEKVAPVQQEKPAEKPTPRKESRVVKAKPAEKKLQKKEVKTEMSEELPEQMYIEDFPEILPETEDVAEDMEEVDAGVENAGEKNPESRISTLAEGISEEDKKKTVAGYKAGITSALHNMPRYIAAGNWEKVGTLAMEIKWRADKIQELEEKKDERIC